MRKSLSTPFSPTRRAALAAGLLLASLGAPLAHAGSDLKAALEPILKGAHRSDDNKARDQYRHPQQTLEFFGVTPKSTVIEVTPGRGWYSEVLAPLVMAEGKYVAATFNPAGMSQANAAGATKSVEALKTRFAAWPAQFGKASVTLMDLKAPVFGPENSADFVLTFRNVHNWVMAKNHAEMFKGAFAVLKPGGVLGVVDHRATKGAQLDKVINTGYLPEDFVVAEAEKAGFKLESRSAVNDNPKDTKDYKEGVWTLPPVLALGKVDDARYKAIGESDRFTLRFVKPAK